MSSSVRDDDTAPPRASRGLVWRGLLAGVLICLSTAGAVSASVLLFAADCSRATRWRSRWTSPRPAGRRR